MTGYEIGNIVCNILSLSVMYYCIKAIFRLFFNVTLFLHTVHNLDGIQTNEKVPLILTCNFPYSGAIGFSFPLHQCGLPFFSVPLFQ